MPKPKNDLLKRLIADEEGLELEAYQDSHKKLWHIGYGHLLEQEQSEEELEALGLEDELDDWKGLTISQEQADQLLKIDVQDAIDDLSPAITIQVLDELGETRSAVLISMCFQMGGGGVRKFKSFIKAVKEKDWERASAEMEWSNGLTKKKRSAWYNQTPKRCLRASFAMLHGYFKEYQTEKKTPTTEKKLVEYEQLEAEVMRRIAIALPSIIKDSYDALS